MGLTAQQRGPAAASALVLFLLSACASAPPTMQMIVPSAHGSPELDQLSRSTGATAEMLTVSGRQVRMLLGPTAPGALSGTNLTDQSTIALPFDSLAVVYFLKPKKSGGERAGVITDFPRLVPTEAADGTLACPQLDTELARAKALRWFARSRGAIGWTGSQRFAHDAAMTGLTVLLVAGMAGGGGPGCCSQKDPLEGWQLGGNQLRQSITAADWRIESLLRLKLARSCPESPALGAATDLGLLAQLEAASPQPSVMTLTTNVERQELVRRTMLLDQLGPAPLPPIEPILEPGESLLRVYGGAQLYVGRKISMNVGDPPPEVGAKSTLVFTDKALLILPLNDEGLSVGKRVRINYADISSIEMVNLWHMLCHNVITRRDSQVDALISGRLTCSAAEEIRAFVNARMSDAAPAVAP